MPRGDGTGPAGMGPMTGRAAGYCAGYAVPGFMNQTPGRGRGGGQGRRNWFHATGLTGWQRAAMGGPAWGGPWPQAASYAAPFAPAVTREQELAAMKGQTEYFQGALEDIQKRIAELESQASESNQ